MSTDDNLKLPKEIEAYCKDEDKDRELDTIIDNSFGMFLKEKENPIYLNIKDQAISQIKALYKPLLEELEYLVNGIKRYSNDPYQEELPEIKDAAQAIINARGK